MPDSRIIGMQRKAVFSWLMTGLCLLVFALGAAGLNSDPFWSDEVYAVGNMGGFNGERSPEQIVRSVTEHFPDHVPLFFLVGAGWASLAGWTAFALRLLPALCGVLLIAFVYRLGCQVRDWFTGLLAAALVGGSAYIVLYLHDFRMYAPLLMLAALHCWLYWRLLARQSAGAIAVFVFALSTVALLYTHLFSLILLAGLCLGHLLCARSEAGWRRALWGWGIGGLCFAPYLPVLLQGMQEAAEKTYVTSRAASALDLLRALLYLLGNGSWILIALLAAACAYGWLRRRRSRTLQLLIAPMAMLLLILIANEWLGLIPLRRMRYFIILWIPLALIGAVCLAQLPRGWISLLILSLYCLAGWQFYRGDEILDYAGSMVWTRLYPPMQEYVFQLDGKARQHDYLLGFTGHDYVNQDLLLGNSASDYYTQLLLGIDGAFIRDDATGSWLDEVLAQRIDRQPYLLLTIDPRALPANYAEALAVIRQEYRACEVLVDQPDLHIQRFTHALAECGRSYATIEFDNGIQIVDRFGEYRADEGSVKLILGWQIADEAQLETHNISLQLFAPDWEKRWQRDWHLHDRSVLKWQHVEIPTASLPPGDYQVVAIVYDRRTLRKVGGVDRASGYRGEILPLFAFTAQAS